MRGKYNLLVIIVMLVSFFELTSCKENEHLCVDLDKNHTCDECLVVLSNCLDDDYNHECDTCSTNIGSHKEEEETHICSYCKDVISGCIDEDNNYICDICQTETFIDYFPTVPSYIEIPVGSYYQFEIEDQISIKFNNELPTQIHLKWDSESKRLESKYSGVCEIEISLTSDPTRTKSVYITSYVYSNDKYYESYGYELNTLDSFPDCFDKSSNFDFHIIEDKEELLSLYENCLFRKTPQNIVDLSFEENDVLAVYSKTGYSICNYKYSNLRFDESTNKYLINKISIGGSVEDASIELIDIVIIPKAEIDFDINNIDRNLDYVFFKNN